MIICCRKAPGFCGKWWNLRTGDELEERVYHEEECHGSQ